MLPNIVQTRSLAREGTLVGFEVPDLQVGQASLFLDRGNPAQRRVELRAADHVVLWHVDKSIEDDLVEAMLGDEVEVAFEVVDNVSAQGCVDGHRDAALAQVTYPQGDLKRSRGLVPLYPLPDQFRRLGDRHRGGPR